LAVEYAKGFVRNEMMMVIICEKFGWTYYEYLQQPQYFIELIIEKLKVDEQREANQSKKL
jgi:hypothetical protein